jgi:TorA maturation chaperone TorD
MHLSPNEQLAVVPWLKTFPKKVQDRFTTYLYPMGSVLLIVALRTWTDNTDHSEALDQRY